MENIPSGHAINRHCVLVDYANKLSPTCTSHDQTARLFISNLNRRRLRDYLNINFGWISGIP